MGIIESTGAFNSLEGGSKHLDAGAKKVVLTAPGSNCPTYVVGVNEGDYDPENDVVVSNTAEIATKATLAEQAPVLRTPAGNSAQASGWSAVASVGAALGVMGAASL